MENVNLTAVIEVSSDSEDAKLDDMNIEVNDSIPMSPPVYYGYDDYQVHWGMDDDRPAIDYDAPVNSDIDFLCHEPTDKISSPLPLSNSPEDEISSDDTIPYDSQSPKHTELDNIHSGLIASLKSNISHDDNMIEMVQSIVNSKSKKKPKGEDYKKELELKKAAKKAERAKMQEEKMKQKAVKKAKAEKHKSLKPEECIKLLKVHIDHNIINSPLGGSLITTLQESEIQYSVEHLGYTNTIQWSRTVNNKVLNGSQELINEITTIEEESILFLLPWRELVELVAKKQLMKHVKDIKIRLPGKSVTLVTLGLDKYFAYHKNKNNRELKANVKGVAVKKNHSQAEFESLPVISWLDWENAMVDLQIAANCNHRLVQTPPEFAALALQFTKSIASIQFKQERYKAEESLEWYARGDSRQCVKVDASGNGLAKLWQQQITQFPSVGIETAQAIVGLYQTPLVLTEAYRQSDQGEKLLQNVPVRRNAGILSSSRKIGPELSKKIYHFLTSDDPDQEL